MSTIKILLIMVFVFMINTCLVNAQGFSDAELTFFLKNNNRSQAVLIESLTIGQAGEMVKLYDHVGNEEKNQFSDERPILRVSEAKGPFNEEVDFTVLISRKKPLNLKIELYNITQAKKTVIEKIYYWLKPGQTEEICLERTGRGFELDLSTITFYKTITLEIRNKDERYYINLELLSKNKPVSFRKE